MKPAFGSFRVTLAGTPLSLSAGGEIGSGYGRTTRRLVLHSSSGFTVTLFRRSR